MFEKIIGIGGLILFLIIIDAKIIPVFLGKISLFFTLIFETIEKKIGKWESIGFEYLMLSLSIFLLTFVSSTISAKLL